MPRGAWDDEIACGLDPGVVCFDVAAGEAYATVDFADVTGLPQVYYVATRGVGEDAWTVGPSSFCEGSLHNVREGQIAIGVTAWAGWGCEGLPAAYAGVAGSVTVTFF